MVAAPKSVEMVQVTTTHNASASKTDLLLRCQWWASPAVRLPPEQTDVRKQPDAPRFGRAYHKAKEIWLLGKRPPLRAISDEFDVDHARLTDFFRRGSEAVTKLLKKRGWWSSERWVEKKLAYDPFADTGRILSSTKERDYSSKRATELPGTVDLGVLSLKQDVFFDWKTGVKDYDIDGNGQMLSLASAGYKIIRGKVPPIRIIMRIDDDFNEFYEAPTTPDDLEDHRVALKGALGKALSKNPPMVPGTYCNWCNALEICPAQAGAYNAPLLLRDFIDGALDRPHMAMIYGRLLAAENLTKKVREKITEYVRMNGPLELDNGKYAKVVPGTTSNLSQASIKRALGPVQGNDVIQQLREAGCIEEVQYEALKMVPR